jgi:hypothetical protein
MKLSTQLIRACASALLVTLLAACGGGGGGGGGGDAPAVPTTAAQCYNLTNGNEYLYVSTSSPGQYTPAGTTTVSSYAQGLRDVTIQAATFNGVASQSRLSNGTDTFALPNPVQKPLSRFEIFFVNTDTKNIRLGSRTTPVAGIPSDNMFTGFSRSLDLAIGASEIYTYTISSPGTTATSVFEHTSKLLAIEDIVTPAGTFKNACKFSLVSTQPGLAPPTGNSDIFWYAPGWGVVKEIFTRTYTDGRNPAVRTETSEVTSILKGSL